MNDGLRPLIPATWWRAVREAATFDAIDRVPLRRRLAALALAAVLVTGGVMVAVAPPPPSAEAQATMELVRRFDALADQLPEQELLTSRQEMIAWAIEILPYMAYELGMAQAVPPVDIFLFYRMDARAFHLGGQAACTPGGQRGPIALNGRYANPVSAVYGRETAIATLVHELIHMQGGPFCSGTSEDLEANTSIATVEVLAAMVNHGNLVALRPLLLELRGMGLSALQYELPRDQYLEFLDSVSGDPFDMARADKAYRFWSASPGGRVALGDILRKYNVVPWNAVTEAVGDGTVERIQLWLPEENGYGPMKADDLVYFFRHAEAYVASVTQAPAGGTGERPGLSTGA